MRLRLPAHPCQRPHGQGVRLVRQRVGLLKPPGRPGGAGECGLMAALPVLRCEGLRKSFGERVAVDGVGFTIAAGETYGLLGPNGAGKTTTISMICGLLSADAGEVEVAGHRLGDDPLAVKASIGYVPQEVALYEDLSARENLEFFG